MEIKKAEFVISAVKPTGYPETDMSEVAFVGRSNVGKSSLINTITNRRKLVKVSQTPGKTKLVNFFIINDAMHFVDLPGYGYAKVSKKERESWGKTIEMYLHYRPQLSKVVLLLDCRRVPNEDDKLMYKWIQHYNYEPVIVMTKIDKLNRSEIVKAEKTIRATLNIPKEIKIYNFSSLKKIGKEELTDKLLEDIAEK
ncbi:ribosome biogenesis GTP-binding protein YihA/YsxC [Clostridium bornimense]|uniref:ribosome biogenesis GTP-binding protein YihA/YsxC n=1 Tax=Clostridium bornimense TaxID=1216932 RepID=UPI001C126AF5|nr:ribosome biogenesis GTP-binding protein YihA/YsxC [Clostridium bornimense]MBU5316425.1 ribosome biogenesis GTP-binding protein YihA/YsxC [Clostridium bornimense]